MIDKGPARPGGEERVSDKDAWGAVIGEGEAGRPKMRPTHRGCFRPPSQKGRGGPVLA